MRFFAGDEKEGELKMSVKVKELKQGKATRYSFGKCKELLKVPALLEIQKKSYKDYLEKGIKRVFDEFFPVTDYSGKAKSAAWCAG